MFLCANTCYSNLNMSAVIQMSVMALVCFYLFATCSSKGSTLPRRGCKKVSETSGKGDESGRSMEAQVPLEDLERNQKILQWMMEGDRQRKSTHG